MKTNNDRKMFAFENLYDDGEYYWFTVWSYNALFRMDKKSWLAEYMGSFSNAKLSESRLYEQIIEYDNKLYFTPGLATKINSRFASKILVSYPETVKFLPKNKQSLAVVTGNPVRPVFYEADAQKGRKFLFEGKNADLKKPVLLVLGGSLGAHQLNELVVENLAWLTEHFNVVHQCGSKDASFVPAQTDSYFPYPFIYEQMPDVIACADVILSRAGANTVWESAVEKKPSVLIPLCGNGTRGDQVDNANFFKERGAAFVLTGNEAVFENLRNCLEKLLDKKERDLMSQKMAELASGKRASLKIAELIFKNIGGTIKVTSV